MVSEKLEKLPAYIEIYPDEKELLLSFLRWFNEKNPDIVIGWHVIGFDLMFLENKCKELNISFDIDLVPKEEYHYDRESRVDILHQLREE